jgi:hypothetical protein
METLREALHKLDESALTKLVAAHENGEHAKAHWT